MQATTTQSKNAPRWTNDASIEEYNDDDDDFQVVPYRGSDFHMVPYRGSDTYIEREKEPRDDRELRLAEEHPLNRRVAEVEKDIGTILPHLDERMEAMEQRMKKLSIEQGKMQERADRLLDGVKRNHKDYINDLYEKVNKLEVRGQHAANLVARLWLAVDPDKESATRPTRSKWWPAMRGGAAINTLSTNPLAHISSRTRNDSRARELYAHEYELY